jgi:HAD superfamily hydrolase (TIGR01509 family)
MPTPDQLAGAPAPPRPVQPGEASVHARHRLTGAIFDVDGVLVASPHERAWREALDALLATLGHDAVVATGYRPGAFTTTVYQQIVAGRPRLDGARAVLEYFAVPAAADHAPAYAALKQRRVDELIAARAFAPFPDALRFVCALKAAGLRLAVASSSKNATALLAAIDVTGTAPGATLLSLFDADLCGRDLPQGKPHPAIFLLAARELALAPADCLVVEDAPAGIVAAKAAGMTALGVARLGDAALLTAAGADLVVTTLDDVVLASLFDG